MPKVTSTRRIAANRRSALRSTGPVTREGKARAARNALRHGILSPQVVVDGDDAERVEDFHALLDSLLDQFNPRDVIERSLVQRVAACFWRLRRAQRFEVGALREALADSRKNHDPAGDEIARLDAQLLHVQGMRSQRETDLQYLQSLNLDDPKVLNDARPMMDKLRTRYSGAVWNLPLHQAREILLRELPAEIREYDEREIPAARKRLDDAREAYKVRLERRALTACLPAPEEVLKLVRYENMLDRQLHRALDQLRRRKLDPAGPEHAPNEESK